MNKVRVGQTVRMGQMPDVVGKVVKVGTYADLERYDQLGEEDAASYGGRDAPVALVDHDGDLVLWADDGETLVAYEPTVERLVRKVIEDFEGNVNALILGIMARPDKADLTHYMDRLAKAKRAAMAALGDETA